MVNDVYAQETFKFAASHLKGRFKELISKGNIKVEGTMLKLVVAKKVIEQLAGVESDVTVRDELSQLTDKVEAAIQQKLGDGTEAERIRVIELANHGELRGFPFWTSAVNYLAGEKIITVIDEVVRRGHANADTYKFFAQFRDRVDSVLELYLRQATPLNDTRHIMPPRGRLIPYQSERVCPTCRTLETEYIPLIKDLMPRMAAAVKKLEPYKQNQPLPESAQ